MDIQSYHGNREALGEFLELCESYRLTNHLNLSATNLNDLVPNLVIRLLVKIKRPPAQLWRKNLGRLLSDLPPQRFDEILSHFSIDDDQVALDMAEQYANGESLWKRALSLPIDAPVTPENCQYILLSRTSSNELYDGEPYHAYMRMILAKGGYTISAYNLGRFVWRYYVNYTDEDIWKVLLNCQIEPPERLLNTGALRDDPELYVHLIVSTVKADLRLPLVALPPSISFAQMRPMKELLFAGYLFSFFPRSFFHQWRQHNRREIPWDEDSAFWIEMGERNLYDTLGYECGFNLEFFKFNSTLDPFYDRYLLRIQDSIFARILRNDPSILVALSAYLKFGYEAPWIEYLHRLGHGDFRFDLEWCIENEFNFEDVSAYRRLFSLIKPFNVKIANLQSRYVLLDMMHNPDLYWQEPEQENEEERQFKNEQERMEWIEAQLVEIEGKLAERTSLLLALVNNRLDLVPPFDGKPAELSDLSENPVVLSRILRAYPREHLQIILRNLLEASLAPMVMTVNMKLLNIFVRVYAPADILSTCIHPVIKRLLSLMLHLHPRVRSCYGDQEVFKSSLEFRDWILTRLCCIRQPQIKMILMRYYFCNLADSRYQGSHFLTHGKPFGLGLRAERVIKGELSFVSDDEPLLWIFD